jgi:hypothetical protein
MIHIGASQIKQKIVMVTDIVEILKSGLAAAGRDDENRP